MYEAIPILPSKLDIHRIDQDKISNRQAGNTCCACVRKLYISRLVLDHRCIYEAQLGCHGLQLPRSSSSADSKSTWKVVKGVVVASTTSSLEIKSPVQMALREEPGVYEEGDWISGETMRSMLCGWWLVAHAVSTQSHGSATPGVDYWLDRAGGNVG